MAEGQLNLSDAPRSGLEGRLAAGPLAGPKRQLPLAALLLLLVLAGCGPFVDPYNLQDHADTPAGVLGRGATIGQSFVAQCDGLADVDVQVAVYPGIPRTSGSLTLTLWQGLRSADQDDPSVLPTTSGTPLATTAFRESALEPNQWVRFSFRPTVGSRGQAFIVRAEATDPGTSPVTLWATGHVLPENSARFADGRRVEGALVYRTFCDPSAVEVAQVTLATVGRSAALWPVALLLCLLPGLGFAALISSREADPAALLGLATGWSILLAPIAVTLATPWRVGPAMGGALLGIGTVLLVWRHPRPRLSPWSALALAASVVALIVRAVDAQGLVAPMWGDPVQHSYVASLILDQRGVPATYGPLMPPQVFDYHFGFQTLAAFASWLTRANTTQAVLATGQILDALICLPLYLFARDLTGSERAGAVAAVLVAMVTTQPAYFVTWGRYPELAALAALPAAASALRVALRSRSDSESGTGPAGVETSVGRPRGRPPDVSTPADRRQLVLPALRPRLSAVRQVALAAVATAAMIVVHPRGAIFLGCLGVGFVVADLVESRTWRAFGSHLLRLATVGVASLILVSPWALRLWAAHQQQVVAGATWQPIDFPLGLATAGNDGWVLALAVAGLLVGVFRRPALTVLFAVWLALVFILTNPATFHLPIDLFLNDGSIAIALFVPATILVGFLFDSCAAVCQRVGSTSLPGPKVARSAMRGRAAAWTVAGMLFLGGLSQAPSLTTIVNPCCLLIRPPDVAAINWAREHTPPNARFVINGYRWLDTVWMGSDAGYWLPVLARRRTTLPPLFYGVGPPGQVATIDSLAASVNRDATDPAALAALGRRIGARYVFIGTRGGDLDPSLLAQSGLFRVDYRAGGAWVLELVTPGPALSSTTDTGITPAPNAPPSDSKAAGLRSRTSG